MGSHALSVYGKDGEETTDTMAIEELLARVLLQERERWLAGRRLLREAERARAGSRLRRGGPATPQQVSTRPDHASADRRAA
jgi:hypothetical protein